MKREKRQNLLILLAAYLGVIAVFLLCIFSTPYIIKRYEKRYINEAEVALYKIITESPEQDLEQSIQQFKEQYPLEIAIYNEKSLVFQTLPVKSLQALYGSIDRNAIILEVHGEIDTAYQTTYKCWYAFYHPTLSKYIQNFIFMEMFLLVISFLILLTVIYLLQKRTIKPLEHVKQSIQSLSKYDFEKISHQATDTINEQVQHFAVSLKNNIQAVSRQHSNLEQALQLERERLSNLITISRGLVHDLKTPVHQVMIENELAIKAESGKNKALQKLAGQNMMRTENLMLQINNILEMLDTDVREMMEVVDDFDIIETYKEIRESFLYTLEQKQIIIDSQIPEILNIHLNKVAVYLILHNILSNAIKYALDDSDIELVIDQEEKYLFIECTNQTSPQNISRIENSEHLFFAERDEVEDAYIYSTGNGLYLIKELTNILGGKYELRIEKEGIITIQIVISMDRK